MSGRLACRQRHEGPQCGRTRECTVTNPGGTSVSCDVSKRTQQLPKNLAKRLASECPALHWTVRIRRSVRRPYCSLPVGLGSVMTTAAESGRTRCMLDEAMYIRRFHRAHPSSYFLGSTNHHALLHHCVHRYHCGYSRKGWTESFDKLCSRVWMERKQLPAMPRRSVE